MVRADDGQTEEVSMRKIVLSVLIAAGVGLAGASGASATPAAGGFSPATGINPLVQKAYVVVVGKPRCYTKRTCYINRWGHRHCSYKRVCR
jgi:hypothetical protein